MPELRPYQKEDLDFLLRLNSAGIFSEQRTGKTPIAIEYAKAKNIKRTLVLCPPSAIPVWTTAWNQWYPQQQAVAVLGKDRQAKLSKIDEWTNMLAISYDTLKATKVRKGFIDPLLAHGLPDLVIIDEAHRIQTRNAAATSAVFQFCKAPLKLALTGTPASNKPYQIFSILRWLYPKTFTSYWKYVYEFYDTEKETNYSTGATWTSIGGFISKEKKTEHAEMLNSISVQRKRAEVMQWLPPKNYIQIGLDATPQMQKALNHLNKYFEIGSIETQGILDSLIRERQLCLCPEIFDIKGGSPKFEWLLDYISDYPSRQILVFSKLTSGLRILAQQIRKKLPKYAFDLYIGDTLVTKRAQLVNDFQKKKIQLLLLNVDAAKEAITLDEAEVAIFLDTYPPAGSIAQAEDRFVATTPEKADKQHDIIQLFIKDTYDEQLYKIVENNLAETEAINNYKLYLENKQRGE